MDYMKELNVAITVCDKEGKILQMNDKSQKTNHGDLVGQNVLDCHPEPARTKLVQLMTCLLYTSNRKIEKRSTRFLYGSFLTRERQGMLLAG